MTEEFTFVGIDVSTRPADQNWSVPYDEAGLEPTAVICRGTVAAIRLRVRFHVRNDRAR